MLIVLGLVGTMGCIQTDVISPDPLNPNPDPNPNGSTGGNTAGSDNGSGGGSGAASGADSTICGELPLDNCQSNTSCSILVGQRVTGNPACVAPPGPVACGTNQGCMMVATRATDPAGADWIFPTTCIPAAWTNDSTRGTRFDACLSR